MTLLARSIPVLSITWLMIAPALADTPNLHPGMWSHHSTTTFEGPIPLPSQQDSDQHCFTQQDLDKGIDVLSIPKACTITRADIKRDRADYAANCNREGMNAEITGHARFHGERMDGSMNSEMHTPMGTMTMLIHYQAQRIGDCP